MKLSLVATQGKAEGKAIPITVPQFVIGRDPQCQLRPASPVISKRHCAVLTRGGKAFVQDLNSSNGTFINDQQIQGEIEVHNGDKLKVGPLVFTIQFEASRTPVNKPTPAPKKKADEPVDYESMAAMLLASDDEESAGGEAPALSQEEILSGSTMTDFPAVPPPEEKPQEPAAKKKEPPKSDKGNTSDAAAALLAKFSRRKPG